MYSQVSLATFFPYQELVSIEISEKPIINKEEGRKIVTNSTVSEDKILEFVDYVNLNLKGYEKGEAQLFLERLFQCFGHRGIKESGAFFEDQIKVNGRTNFLDLIWPRKVLFEMKSRGEKLEKHFVKTKEYWDNAYEKKTEYVVLCNFDEFWIYNWNQQKDPLDKVPLEKLNEMWRSFPFLCREEIKPIFGNNLVDVTEKAAEKVAKLYKSLIDRSIEEKRAQRFTLQCLVALFAEDTGLFPEQGFFIKLIDNCIKNKYSKELFNSLFVCMNSKESPTEGAFKGVRYFDGGIFSEIDPIDLNDAELTMLYEAAKENWSKVQPSIFGNIFEGSLSEKERHKFGAHYTYESDIMRIVEPTILRPWRERIEATKKPSELRKIWDEISKFKVLDPACGSGNFLYISFRELKSLELLLIKKLIELDPALKPERLKSKINSTQFYGIEKNTFAVELAKITLSMAKKIAVDEFNNFTKQNRLFLDEIDDPLPFDNLEYNIIADDALLVDWPKVDAIIGNPPFQSKNKMQEEFGPDYINKIKEKIPGINGKADYCVYWFRKAHDMLPQGGRAGLVGTKTISQTNSRIGGLDYIVSHDGTIVEAVARMPWSGEAAVDVSIVNWIKGIIPLGKRKLAIQPGNKKNGPWEEYELSNIPSSLSSKTDVTKAKTLDINRKSQTCYQGQIHGHNGFLLTYQEKSDLIKKEPKAEGVLFSYLTADELIGNLNSQPKRFIIDFQSKSSLPEVMDYPETFSIVKEKVLPAMILKAEKEKNSYKNSVKKINARQNHLDTWWLLHRRRDELIQKISKIQRYIVCGQVTKRQIFEFVSSKIRPNAALIVFPLEDDFSFGILQSSLHWNWFTSTCSTLSERFRYTIETTFDSFPWPQWGVLSPEQEKLLIKKKKSSDQSPIDLARNVAKKARDLRVVRNELQLKYSYSLRELYRTLELPGNNDLRDAQEALDSAVSKAYYYGLPKEMQKMDTLELLLKLNTLCSQAEETGKNIIGPGLPSFCKDHFEFFSDDCVRFEE